MRWYLRGHRHKPDSNASMQYNLLCSFRRRFLRHNFMHVDYSKRKLHTKPSCLHYRSYFRSLQSHRCNLLHTCCNRSYFLPMVSSDRCYHRKRSGNYLHHRELQRFIGKQQRLRLLSDMCSCHELLRIEPSSLCEPLHSTDDRLCLH